MTEDREIVYTQHAETRLRDRFIAKQDVETGILTEPWEKAEGGLTKVSHQINSKEIQAVFKQNDDKVVVVTVYWK